MALKPNTMLPNNIVLENAHGTLTVGVVKTYLTRPSYQCHLPLIREIHKRRRTRMPFLQKLLALEIVDTPDIELMSSLKTTPNPW